MPNRKSYLNRLPLAVRVPLWKLFKSGSVLINDIQGDVTGNLTGNVTGDIIGDVTGNLNGTMTVVDSTDATSWIALFDSATGDLAPKTDAGLTYNSVTGEITATLIVGPVTGDLTGNVKAADTNNIVTSGATPALSTLTAGFINMDTAIPLDAGYYVVDQDITQTGELTASSVSYMQDSLFTSNITNGGFNMAQIGDSKMIEMQAGTALYQNADISYAYVTGGTANTSFAYEGWVETAGGTISDGTGISFWISNTSGTFNNMSVLAADVDGVFGGTNYGINLDFTGATGIDYGLYFDGEGDNYLSGSMTLVGALALGVLDTTAGGLTLHGTATTTGASMKMYNAADATIVSYDMAVSGEDFTIGPNTDPDMVKLLGATLQTVVSGSGGLAVPAGTLQVGVDDTTRGHVEAYGSASGNLGGRYTAFTGADHDGAPSTIESYQFQVIEDDLMIGPNTDQDSLMYAGDTDVWGFTGTGLNVDGVLTPGTIAWGAVLTVNETWNGETVSRIIDTAAAVFGEGLYLAADGNYEHSDADAVATMPCIAVACEAYEASTAKTLLIRGMICDTDWAWSAPGVTLYASATAGAFTETAPAGAGDQVQVIGYALSADTIWFEPDMTLIEIA